MITLLTHRLSRFRKEESGAIYTLEFAVMFPLLLLALAFGVEFTTHAKRQFQVDRALEVTTRAIKLNTATSFTHQDIVETICNNSGGLKECSDRMRLEMTAVNPRNFQGLAPLPECENASADANPVDGWSLGEQHELMMLRACYKFSPVFPGFGLGALIGANDDGYGKMIAVSAFVQEPE
jgi:hypothetical protein